MRNLKKVLSLTLALVMMLGMMTFAGAAEAKKITAADFKDMDKVENKEAVSLLVDLGVLNGIKAADGTYTFNPAGNIERGAYAKMIYAVMMASNNADVYKGVNTGLKDVAGHWAEGFIGYCVTTKLAVGNGNGTFTPNANITTVAAAKMLLVALGYDAKASGYEGDELWSINIMRDAQKAGLLNNVDQKASENLSRDNAAQLIFNALFARTVVANYQYDMGVKYLTKYEPNATTLGNETYGLFMTTATVGELKAGKLSVTMSGTTPAAVKGDLKTDLDKMTGTVEMLGNSITVYYKATYSVTGNVLTQQTYKNLFSSTFFTSGSNVVKMVNDGTKLSALLTIGGKKYVGTLETDAKFYINGGADQNSVYYATAAATDSSNVFDNAFAKPGVIVELINNDDDAKIEIVKVTNKTVRTLTGDVSTKAITGADTQVRVPGVINGYSDADTVKTVVGYEGLKKGDVVLFVKIGATTYIEKPASVEGKVTAKNSDEEIQVGGTYYGNSGLAGTKNDWSGDYKNTYKFYLDDSKSIVKAEKLTAEEAASSVAVVLDIVYVNDNVAAGAAASGHAEAQILHTDGTVEVVKINTIDGYTPVSTAADIGSWETGCTYYTTGTTKALDEASTITIDKTSAGTTAAGSFYTAYKGDSTTLTAANRLGKYVGVSNGNAAVKFEKEFFSYTVDSKGVYTLTSMAKDTAGSAANKIENGKPSLLATATHKATANANTLFLVKTGTDSAPVYTAYKGIAKVPSMSSSEMTVVLKDGLAAYVYVYTPGALSGTVGEYVYIPGDADDNSFKYTAVPKADGSGVAYYEIKAIVDGVAGTIKVSTATEFNPASDGNKMFTVATKDADGVILTKGTTTPTVGIKVAGGTLTTESTILSVDADTQIFYIATDGAVTTLDYTSVTDDTTDNVIVAKSTGTVANIVYIMQVVNADTEMTKISYTYTTAAGVVTAVKDADLAATAAAADKTVVNNKLAAGDIIKITDVTCVKGTTYTVSGTGTARATTGAAAAEDKITITLTSESGLVTADVVLSFGKA